MSFNKISFRVRSSYFQTLKLHLITTLGLATNRQVKEDETVGILRKSVRKVLLNSTLSYYALNRLVSHKIVSLKIYAT